MEYKLAKQLKEAGFPQGRGKHIFDRDKKRKEKITGKNIGVLEIPIKGGLCYVPTLSELIEACGDEFRALRLDSSMKTENNEQWACDRVEHGVFETFIGKTPEESVARLYIKLNKK